MYQYMYLHHTQYSGFPLARTSFWKILSLDMDLNLLNYLCNQIVFPMLKITRGGLISIFLKKLAPAVLASKQTKWKALVHAII